ncbi:hypothetical protein BP00DRAFT_166580 [Aspergillus indologenus CBS 114.80]|uniref:Uncharacterized protein n=1 Tax=Aspergillus indologenus CBS 114.80 TaxID=1450541 RepID=A0A2V5ITH1_9EURO|nr:hypothetical protein BP00DRAFT_166580 [Aspergillus indologenus CBS 114.80]
MIRSSNLDSSGEKSQRNKKQKKIKKTGPADRGWEHFKVRPSYFILLMQCCFVVSTRPLSLVVRTASRRKDRRETGTNTKAQRESCTMRCDASSRQGLGWAGPRLSFSALRNQLGSEPPDKIQYTPWLNKSHPPTQPMQPMRSRSSPDLEPWIEAQLSASWSQRRIPSLDWRDSWRALGMTFPPQIASQFTHCLSNGLIAGSKRGMPSVGEWR